MGAKRYIDAKQFHLVSKQRMVAYNEANRIKKMLERLCMLNPNIVGDVEEFWQLREKMKHLSRVLDNQLRKHFLLRVGDVNPLRKIIK